MSHPPNPNEEHVPEHWHVVQESHHHRGFQNGAGFFANLSDKNDTEKNVTKWRIEISQGDWSGETTSTSSDIHTDGLSGEFKVRVWASGPNMPEKQLKNDARESGPNVECSIHCNAMIMICSTDSSGSDARYFTKADVLCQ
jgi:hypothetical protein